MTDGTSANPPHWALLEQRVGAIERKLDDMKEDFKEQKHDQKSLQEQLIEIHKAILSIGKPQYTVISGFAAVILAATVALWGLAVKPINDDIARLYSANKDIANTIGLLDANKASREDVRGPIADIKARIDEFNARIKR